MTTAAEEMEVSGAGTARAAPHQKASLNLRTRAVYSSALVGGVLGGRAIAPAGRANAPLTAENRARGSAGSNQAADHIAA